MTIKGTHNYISNLFHGLPNSSVNEEQARFIFICCCYSTDKQSFAILQRRHQLLGFYFYFVFPLKRTVDIQAARLHCIYIWYENSVFFLKNTCYCTSWFGKWHMIPYQRSHSNACTQGTESKLWCVNLIWSLPDLVDGN